MLLKKLSVLIFGVIFIELLAALPEFPMSVSEIREAKRFLTSDLSPEHIQIAENIRKEYLRVNKVFIKSVQKDTEEAEKFEVVMDKTSARTTLENYSEELPPELKPSLIIKEMEERIVQQEMKNEVISDTSVPYHQRIFSTPVKTGGDLLALFFEMTPSSEDMLDELQTQLESHLQKVDPFNSTAQLAWIRCIAQYALETIEKILPAYSLKLHNIYRNSIYGPKMDCTKLLDQKFGEEHRLITGTRSREELKNNPRERSLTTGAGIMFHLEHVYDNFFGQIDSRFGFTRTKLALKSNKAINKSDKEKLEILESFWGNLCLSTNKKFHDEYLVALDALCEMILKMQEKFPIDESIQPSSTPSKKLQKGKKKTSAQKEPKHQKESGIVDVSNSAQELDEVVELLKLAAEEETVLIHEQIILKDDLKPLEEESESIVNEEITVVARKKHKAASKPARLLLLDQIFALQPNQWLNKKSIAIIYDICDTAHKAVRSNGIARFLQNLVNSQTSKGLTAVYDDGKDSHKLAVLISSEGLPVLFPFAHHAGKDLDRHSRDMIIDGFKTLFGISA